MVSFQVLNLHDMHIHVLILTQGTFNKATKNHIHIVKILIFRVGRPSMKYGIYDTFILIML